MLAVAAIAGALCAQVARAQAPSGTFAAVGADHSVQIWRAGAIAGRAVSGTGAAAAALSNDGLHLFVACGDGAVRVWSTATGVAERTIAGAHPGGVTCVAASPDGRLLASGGVDGKVRLWNAQSGAAVATLNAGVRPIRAIAWSPDSALLATGGDTGAIQIWRADGRPAGMIVGHEDTVTGLAWLADSARLVSVARDGSLKLWRISDFSLIGGRQSHDRGTVALAVSPNGSRVVTAGADGKLRVWTVTPAGFTEAGPAPPDGQTTALAWDRASDALICGQSDGSIRYRRGADLGLLGRVSAGTGAIVGIALAPAAR